MSALELSVVEGLLAGKGTLVPKVNLRTHSKPWSKECQIEANNDVEAVRKWLQEYQHKKNTYVAYRREALRFLVWCSYSQGKALAELKKEDLEAYFLFLQQPQNWLEEIKGQKALMWQPFKKPLSQSALMTAVRILNSLFNYLVQAEYLRANPIKLIKQYTKLGFDTEERKYQVWQRVLERDEWIAVQKILMEMPERTTFEVNNKMRTQFLFAVLYFLGLRIHEVVNLGWNSFRQKGNGQWWFFVRGKGNKPRHISVNDQLLEFIKTYRIYLKKSALPMPNESEPLFVSQRTKRPLKLTRLYTLVKAVGEEAAKAFPGEPQKQEKLRKFSPHWMRHLSATHQDALGFSESMIMSNLGHASRETTQIYVHSEDDERFKEMQKLKMLVEPKMIQQNKKTIGIEYRLSLSKGPINRVIGLSRLMASLEQQIFKDIEWIRIEEAQESLFEKIKSKSVYEKIELIYQLSSKIVVEAPNIWMNAIKRQCEIWLFFVEMQMKEIEET